MILPSRPGRRLASGLLFTAMLLHNLEEGVAYPAARPAATQLVQRIWPVIDLPAPGAFQAALAILTATVGVLLLWAAGTRREQAGWLAIRVTAAILLANVIVPHVPAAIALGGYAPGVLTAVALNLPLGLWILRRGALAHP